MMAFAPWGSGTSGFQVWRDPEAEDFYRRLDAELFSRGFEYLRDANVFYLGF